MAAIFLLAYVLYFRRHRRADLLLAYVALNIGIFVAMSLLSKVRVDIALGFGLFAILSIIRLRSTSVTQQEVAYYFVALVLGLVNGLDIDDRRLVVLVNVLLLATMAVVDSRRLRDRARPHGRPPRRGPRRRRRAGGRPGAPAGRHGDVPRGQRRRLRARDHGRRRALPGRDGSAEPEPDERRLEVTLDVIHADDAALVADLERRLGGRVLRHEVKDIDYVRDTMDVDVRYRVWTPASPDRPAGPQPRPTRRPAGRSPAHRRPQHGRRPAPAAAHRARRRRAHRGGEAMTVVDLRHPPHPRTAPRRPAAATAAPSGPAATPAERAVAAAAAMVDPIGLDELMELAELQTRVDRKYFVPADVFRRMIGELAGELRVLDIDGLRTFGYESVYFDTPDLTTYRAHVQRRRQRFKARTRTYTDSGLCMFEVKLTGRARRDRQAARAAPGSSTAPS